MNENKKTLTNLFAVVIFFIIIFSVFITTYGFSIMLLWNWFISPLGVSNISIMQGFGISLFIKLLTIEVKNNDYDDKSLATGLAILIYPFFAISIGFILKSLM